MNFIVKNKHKSRSAMPGALVIILALGMIMAVFFEEVRAESLTCSSCGKPISDKYLSVGEQVFHKNCFTCAYCGNPIKGRFSLDGDKPYHPDCYLTAKNFVCTYCNKILDPNWVEVDGKKYHPACYKNHVQLRCGICGKPILGPYVEKDGIYHESCYREYKLDRCVVCSHPIFGRHLVDVWGNKAHTEHEGLSVSLCDSCGRIISKQSSKGGITYSDGRTTCGYCRMTAVMHLSNPDFSERDIGTLFSKVGIVGIPGKIPVNLVSLDALKQKSDDSYRDSARGYTVSSRFVKKGESPRMEYAIYILKGLPMEEFKAVLAHEMLHVWLVENAANLSERETEGFCNLGAMLVYQKQDSEFSRHHLKQLENDSDPIYGDGYRIMKFRLDHMGWKGLLEDILRKR